MTITVKLFAILKDRAGISESTLEALDGTTAQAACKALCLIHPGITPYISKIAYAVNEQYVPAATELYDGDELALIPPVSGG